MSNLTTAERNRDNRIKLFEVSVKELLEEVANDSTIHEATQPICLEVVNGDKVVQLQVTIVTQENDFVEDFTTVVTRPHHFMTN